MLVLRSAWGLGDRGLRRVVDGLGSAGRGVRNPGAMRGLLPPRAQRPVRPLAEARRDALATLARTAEAGLRAVSYGATGYPERLRALSDPPAILWTRGDAALLDLPAVAVVGARRATESGRRVAHEIGAGIAQAGFVVVSGLALGVDGAAHQGALDSCGLTLAVLGSGADRPTPRRHARLASRISEAGLVVSEFDPGTDAAPFHFPRRNRVIAALGAALVVVEAAARSGALITVDHALDLGRTVFAVPGPLDRPQSAGTNALIRDGATVVTSIADLVDDLRRELRPELRAASRPRSGIATDVHDPAASPAPHSGDAAAELNDVGDRRSWSRLHALLTEGPLDLDELVRRSGLPTPTVAAALLELEVSGHVRAEGARYRCVRP